ncbi:hypothetical protein FQN60_011606 [Etheostoma spectabile]|uniref:Uncharacterized protein n=1 Tax=Etheostoma spectabile TaxID=54343 RepID=A0A5J5DM81_9PERO|nr:hypothetical protein FQN60_011606 [Etheostoma spectabile]
MECQCVILVGEVDDCYNPPLLTNQQLCSVLWFLADRVRRNGSSECNYSLKYSSRRVSNQRGVEMKRGTSRNKSKGKETSAKFKGIERKR